jgi:hypothetical protein
MDAPAGTLNLQSFASCTAPGRPGRPAHNCPKYDANCDSRKRWTHMPIPRKGPRTQPAAPARDTRPVPAAADASSRTRPAGGRAAPVAATARTAAKPDQAAAGRRAEPPSRTARAVPDELSGSSGQYERASAYWPGALPHPLFHGFPYGPFPDDGESIAGEMRIPFTAVRRPVTGIRFPGLPLPALPPRFAIGRPGAGRLR